MTPFQLVVVFFLVVVAAVRARVRGRPVSRKPGHSPSVGRSVVRNPSTPGPLSRPSPPSRRAVRCFDRHHRRARRRRRRHGGECNNNLYFFYVGFSQSVRQAGRLFSALVFVVFLVVRSAPRSGMVQAVSPSPPPRVRPCLYRTYLVVERRNAAEKKDHVAASVVTFARCASRFEEATSEGGTVRGRGLHPH